MTLKRWEEKQISGVTCDIYQPGTSPKFALVFLHGVAGETLSKNETWTQLFQQNELLEICPHGARSWWSSRVCHEFHPEISAEQYVSEIIPAWLETDWNIRSPRIALTEVSMGGQGALRIGFRFPGQFPVVASLAAAIDHQVFFGQGSPLDEMYPDAEAVRQDSVTLHVHPLNYPRRLLLAVDPMDRGWFDGNARLHEKLSALGIIHESDFQTTHGGHGWGYFDAMAPTVIEFLVRGVHEEDRKMQLTQ